MLVKKVILGSRHTCIAEHSIATAAVSFHVIIQHVFMKLSVTECYIPTPESLTALPLGAYISVVSSHCQKLLDTQLSPLNPHQLSEKLIDYSLVEHT